MKCRRTYELISGWQTPCPICDHPFKYVRTIFCKTKIFNPLLRTHMCAYQEVRNVSFSENFAYILNGWTLSEKQYTLGQRFQMTPVCSQWTFNHVLCVLCFFRFERQWQQRKMKKTLEPRLYWFCSFLRCNFRIWDHNMHFQITKNWVSLFFLRN